MCAIYVEIRTDEGVSGLFGPIDESQAFVIQRWLRSFLIGRDPLANELLLDQMLRLDRHGRSGPFMTGVSPVDCALWDLKGKAWDQPVVRLLGGPTRPVVPPTDFLIQHQERKQFFHAPIYRPVGGSLELPALPGLGLVLDEGKIEAREPPCSQPPSSGAAGHDRRVLTHISRPETGLRVLLTHRRKQAVLGDPLPWMQHRAPSRRPGGGGA
jgi:L-alanine-DL-glutamate epimerase-like enolase superfamily enzyme